MPESSNKSDIRKGHRSFTRGMSQRTLRRRISSHAMINMVDGIQPDTRHPITVTKGVTENGEVSKGGKGKKTEDMEDDDNQHGLGIIGAFSMLVNLTMGTGQSFI